MPNKDFTAHLDRLSDEDLTGVFERYGLLSASQAENPRSRYHRIFYAVFGEIQRRNGALDNKVYRNH